MKLREVFEVPGDSFERSKYFWLGPEGKLIPVKTASSMHFVYALEHPEIFGISPEDVIALQKKYQAKHKTKELPDLQMLTDDEDSEELMEKIYAHHWMRVSFDYTEWSVHCDRLNEKNRVSLEMFARNLISNKYDIPEFFASSRMDVEIYPLYGSEVAMELGDIARGQLYEAVAP